MALGIENTFGGDTITGPRPTSLGVGQRPAHVASPPSLSWAPEAARRSAGHFALARSGLGIAPLAADLVALAVAAIGAGGIESLSLTGHGPALHSLAFPATATRLLVTVPLLAVFLAGSTRRNGAVLHRPWCQIAGVVNGVAVGGLVALSGWRLAGWAHLVVPPAPDALLLMCALSLPTVLLLRSARRWLPPWGRHRAQRVLIVGSGLVAHRVAERYASDPGVVVVGFIDDDPTDRSRHMGRLADLPTICERHSVEHVVVAFSRSSNEEIVAALRPIQGSVPITVVPRLFDLLPSTASLHEFTSGVAGLAIAPATLGWGPRALKRTVDVVTAIVALLALSPLLGAIALLIRTTSKGPAFFRQERIGKSGRSFHIVKFRSMYVPGDQRHPSTVCGTSAIGPFPKLKDDPRVTPMGRFLRTTSLDELPQLWNVLRGDMSLVGPRPLTADDSSWIEGWAQRRYSVRPGITGLWQVSGRNDLTFEEMCRLDWIYVSSWSVGLDLRIMLRTLRVIFTHDGAY